MDSKLRVPPHSKEAERSVLGSVLLDRDAVVAVVEFLRPEHFYEDRHQKIFRAVIDLYQNREPVDVITVSEKLNGELDYLKELVNSVPTASHASTYGHLVKDNYTKRTLIQAAGNLMDMGFDESQDIKQILDSAESQVFSLSQQHLSQVFIPVKDILAQSFDRLDELHKSAGSLRGVATGFSDLDDTLAGMQDSNLIILAARPGVGKTALALNICRNAAFGQKLPVGFFSLEMSKEELMDRLLVAQADIDAWKLKTGHLEEDEFTKLSDAMGELYDTPLYIDDTPGMSILEMRTKARRLQAEHGLKLIVVDYLQLARPSRNMDNRVQEVSEISQGLKNLARELKIPVLALSQLSRQVEQRGIKKPQLADLRECLSGDSLVPMAETGKLYKIKDLMGKSGFKVFSLGVNHKLVVSTVKSVVKSGRKKIFALTTQSGRTIRCSLNHPFLTLSGWQKLEVIKINDYIAIPRDLPIDTKIRPELLNTEAKIRLLGHMLGDGCFIPRRILQYTSINRENLEQVTSDAKESFAVKTRIVKERTWYQAYFTSVRPVSKNYRNPMVQWLDNLGIWGLRSPQRFMPGEVFQLPLADIKLFLRHLWATDGCVWIDKKQTRISIYYASASRTLAGNVQSLLLRCGILSNIHVNRKKGYKDVYHVCVDSQEMQTRFVQEIGGFADRLNKTEKAKLILAKIKPNPNLDVIPKQVWQIIDRVRKIKKITWRKFAQLLNMSYCGSTLFKAGVSRNRMTRIATFLDDSEIWNLANSGIYWDKIISITPEKTEEVYDLQVEGSHNFIANDIFVHNSGAIEQDADVVMFLWREDEETLENMTLDIAKHRNGPLRSIKLRFRGDRIRFYSIEGKRTTS